LMLSGIGRPEELELLQIPLVAECAEIGANLSDHPNAGCVWSTDREDSLFGALNDDNLARFQQGEGPLTSNVAEVGGFLRTREGPGLSRRSPPAECITAPLFAPASDSDADIEEHIRHTTQTLYHPVGTCRMGSDATSVVDTELRVRGVEGLRVIDASVMPTVP